MLMASKNILDPATAAPASEAASPSSSSSNPVPDLLSISNPEEHFLRSLPLIEIVLNGQSFILTEVELNHEFFGHRFVTVDDLINFIQFIQKLLMSIDVNDKQLPQLRDYVICKVAKCFAEVRPALKADIQKALTDFYTQLSINEPESLLDIFPPDKCLCCRVNFDCKSSNGKES